jgi:CheY-like chemotaxis protein
VARRILIVDDEPDIREVARVSLEAIGGHEVIAVDSGAAALDAAAREQPDAIILDVMMPGMDGPSTYAHLQEREETRGIPVILLTAKVHAADRSRLAELGVAAVLSKPFDPMTLAGDVAAVLGWG